MNDRPRPGHPGTGRLQRACVVFASALMVAGCGLSSQTSLAPEAVGPSEFAPSSPPRASTPSPSTLVSEPPSTLALDPTTAGWTQVGAVDGAGPLVSSSRGYAMLAGGPDWAFGDTTMVRFSTDGERWDSINLAKPVTNCPGSGPEGDELVNDAAARAIATDGHDLVVVGEVIPRDAAGCAAGGEFHPIAWHSSDGISWRRSHPFGTAGNARATAVWATRDGWQADVDGALWESADGLEWHALPGSTTGLSSDVAAGVARDGTAVRPDPATGGLFVTQDGRTWTPVGEAGGCGSPPGATQVLAPRTPGLDAWVVLNDMRLCTTRDLATWSSSAMVVAPSRVVQTRFGAIVSADACFGAGATCSPDPRAFVSADGTAWRPIAHPPIYVGKEMADGPAGVLMIGSDEGGRTTVWRLDPGTAVPS